MKKSMRCTSTLLLEELNQNDECGELNMYQEIHTIKVKLSLQVVPSRRRDQFWILQCLNPDKSIAWAIDFFDRDPKIKFSQNRTNIAVLRRGVEVIRCSSGEIIARVSPEELANLNGDLDLKLIATWYENGKDWPMKVYPLVEVDTVYRFLDEGCVLSIENIANQQEVVCRDLYGKMLWQTGCPGKVVKVTFDVESQAFVLELKEHTIKQWPLNRFNGSLKLD